MEFEDINFLMHLIEDLRINLNASAKYKSLTDPCIVEMSQRLDHLINEYYLINRMTSSKARYTILDPYNFENTRHKLREQGGDKQEQR